MMRHSHPSHPYPSSHYDDHMCLKPPLLLWVAALYLSRAITLPIAMAIGHFAGVDANAITLFRGFWSVDALIPSLIAAVILYTLCRRVPTAPKLVRWIWAHGQIFLAVSAVMDIALILIALIRQGISMINRCCRCPPPRSIYIFSCTYSPRDGFATRFPNFPLLCIQPTL